MEFRATPGEGQSATARLIEALRGIPTFSTVDTSHINEELGIKIEAGKTMGEHFSIGIADETQEDTARRLNTALELSQIPEERLHAVERTPEGGISKIWFWHIEDVEAFLSVL